MSKIIKAHEEMEVALFDFRTIEDAQAVQNSKAPVTGSVFGNPEEASPEEAAPDPLLELEEMVKNRLFEVERKAEALEREAYEKGYAQGEKDGFEYGRKTMLIVNEHLERVLTGLQDIPRRGIPGLQGMAHLRLPHHDKALAAGGVADEHRGDRQPGKCRSPTRARKRTASPFISTRPTWRL